jgi:hypothetical protein
MELINEMLTELVEISQDYNIGITDKVEANLKLELLRNRIEMVEINYSKQPLDRLDSRIQSTYNQLLFRTKYKAISGFNLLIEATSKKSYNAKLRFILKNKLFFSQLHRTLLRNVEAYVKKNDLKFYNPNTPFFYQGGNKND